MSEVFISIDTVDDKRYSFSKSDDAWATMNAYQRDDLISQWVNESENSQEIISGSNGYTLRWESSDLA